MKAGTVIKDKNGKLVTHSKEVLQVCEEYFMSLLNQRERENWIYIDQLMEN